MALKVLPFIGAAFLAAPAFAVTVNMTDFTFGAADVVTAGNQSYSGEAGQFTGLMAGKSFTAYCVELTQPFTFGIDYDYTMVAGTVQFTAAKATALSRLFTAGQGFVTNAVTSAAMQAAVWEIIYQTGTSYNLTSGDFTVSPEAGNAAEAATFATVNSFLTNLGSYSASYQIDALTNPTAQDFVVVTTVPEPGTWALLAGGLGIVGMIARRRKRA